MKSILWRTLSQDTSLRPLCGEGGILPRLKTRRRSFWSCPQLATRRARRVPRSAFRIPPYFSQNKVAERFRVRLLILRNVVERIQTLWINRDREFLETIARVSAVISSH